MPQDRPDREVVLETFKKFDKNGDGVIGFDELASVLRSLNPTEWTEDAVQRLFQVLDTDQDNRIRLEELMDWAWAGEGRGGPKGAIETMEKLGTTCSFLLYHASNGQPWVDYLAPVPPALNADGTLTGAWAECVYSGCVFELTHPGWHERPEYADNGPVGYVIQYLFDLGYGEHCAALEAAEERYRQELSSEAQAGSRAFLLMKARNGMTWEAYLKKCEPKAASVNGQDMVIGAWGECITAAVIFEHENPRWDLLGPYSADGPAGQVIGYLFDCGHGGLEPALCATEQATHSAFNEGGKLPVFDNTVYQPSSGVTDAEEVDEEPPAPSGRKKALLIGCNYPGQSAELRGCINDVIRWKNTLINLYDFKESDMVILKDQDEPDNRKHSTRANIIAAVRWLVQGAAPGDALFLQFSGHGGQKKSKDSSEEDGKDEVLIPSDYQAAGTIVDHEIFDLCVVPLPSGCKLTVILDCCHSGSALDLPFMWIEENTDWKVAGYTWHTAGDVQMFSGCDDSQCSMDAFDSRMKRPGGAMTTSLCDTLQDNKSKDLTYPELLRKLHEVLAKRNFDQLPRLSSSQAFAPTEKVFSFVDGMIPNKNPQLGQTGVPPAHAADGAGSILASLLGGGGGDELQW